ncbi:MAG: hypothetical protein STSR0004_16910 [Peptococcaceae bacterium]
MEEKENHWLKMLSHQISELALNMEKMKLAEYVNLLENPRRLLYINFIAGVARGLGIAVGFAILGAVIIYVLQRMVALNLPIIGKFIAEIVTIVQTNLAR